MLIYKTKTILVPAVVFLALFSLSCDTVPVQSDRITTWERTFGSDDYERGNQIVEALNGDLVVVGHGTYPDEDFNYFIKAQLLRLDASGHLIWQLSFDMYGDRSYLAMDSGGNVAVAFGSDVARDVRVIKIDPDGQVIWDKVIDLGSFEEPRSLISTEENAFFLAGRKQDDMVGEYPFLLKLSHDGDVIWQKTYESVFGFNVCSLLPTSTGGYIMLDRGCRVLRVNERGNILWYKTVDPGWGGYQCFSAAVVDADKIVVAGQVAGPENDLFNTQYLAHLMVIDAEARVLSRNTWGNTCYDKAMSVAVMHDGGFVVTGHGADDLWLARTNDRCAVRWFNTLTGGEGNGVVACRDGGIALTGTEWRDVPGGHPIYVARTNAQGKIDE